MPDRTIERARIAVEIRNFNLALEQIAAAQRRGQSSDQLKAELEYLKAKSYEGLGQIADAINQYQTITISYPQTPYSYLAHLKLRYLQGVEENSFEALGSEAATVALTEMDEIVKSNSRYKAYVDAVRKKIDLRWFYPCLNFEGGADCEVKDTEVTVEFGIARDGNLSSVKVLRTSGTHIYDFHAVEAIVLAAPFSPIPVDLFPTKSNVSFKIRMEYRDNRTPSNRNVVPEE